MCRLLPIAARSRLGIGNRRLFGLLGLCTLNLLGLLAALCFARGVGAGPISPREFYVSANGTGLSCAFSEPCALATALSQANDGDVIRLAPGVYTGAGEAVAVLEKSVKLLGGWDGASAPTAGFGAEYPAVLNGERARRGLIVRNRASPEIRGLNITRGQGSEGGGIYVESGSPLIIGNMLYDNRAENYGGGIYVLGDEANIANNEIISNSAVYGGGGVSLSSYATATLHGNLLAGNQSADGAALKSDHAIVIASANAIAHNRGNSTCMFSGPAERLVSLYNNVIVENQTDTAVAIWGYRAHLIHNTIANQSGVAVAADFGAAITLTNNIFASNEAASTDVGPGDTLSLSHNLFWRNGSDPATGDHAVLGDPRFVNIAVDDFRPGPGSPAIDAGVATKIDQDLKGNPRPLGAAVDLGAYEVNWPLLHLPLTIKGH